MNRRNNRPGARELSSLIFVVGAWSALYGIELASVSRADMVFLYKLIYVCTAAVPPLWFSFATAFTGSKPLPHVGWVGVGVITFAHLASVLLWPATTLTWTEVSVVTVGNVSTLSLVKGPLFYAFLAYAYLFLAWGALRLAQHAISNRRNYRYQHRIVIAALLIAVIPNVAVNLNLLSTALDPTPFAFTISMLLFTAADRRYNLFMSHPLARNLAREHVIDEMGDGVLVIDRSGVVTDINPAAVASLEQTYQSISGRHLQDVSPTLYDRIERVSDETTTYHHEPTDRTYNVQVSRFGGGQKSFHGKIITLHDVTDVRQREERLAVLNRILRHDIRNGLNVVDGYAGLIADETTSYETKQDAARHIRGRTDELLELAEKIRSIEKGLDTQANQQPTELMGVLQTVIDRIDRDWPSASLSLSGPDEVQVLTCSIVEPLFHNIVENAAEHGGDAPTIDVSVTPSDEWVTIEVADDGPGIPAAELAAIESGETQLLHTSGVGLWLVTWLVRQSNGTIDFDVGDDGTTVRIRLRRVTGRQATPETVIAAVD
ncbi:histidine kinase N-terminal 7TM domain-containing protein [Haloferax sp. S1W]|uniref:histidine kinase N-terminal 7TM domain-containing protein n=1 Tax=Haloferax sp. S1W TaxID=3377110 RepID=UPI0037CB449C